MNQTGFVQERALLARDRRFGERGRVLDLLQCHGWNSTSFQILERGFSYWFDPAVDACVAYVDTGHAWVAAGAPIAAPGALEECGRRFIAAAASAGRRVVFFAVEERFAAKGALVSSMPIGEQPTWDPRTWTTIVGRERRLREQLRRACSKGVVVRRVAAEEMLSGPTRAAVDTLVARWLASRKMPPMGFVVDVQLDDFLEERRFFVAERAGRVVGLLAAVPVYRREGRGWFFEDLLRDEHAPNGTNELLFDTAIRAARDEGSAWVTLGLAPLAGGVSSWMRFVSACSAALYDFDGVRRFKAKLRPDRWTPIHLAWPRGASAALALFDALGAFTIRPRRERDRSSFVRFGIETAIHAPKLAVRLLAFALVPWTLGIGLVSTTRYFPSPAVQQFWLGWDVVLGVGLFALSFRWRSSLAAVLAVATSLDALLTIIEVLLDGAHRARHGLDGLVVLVACVGPTLAAALLWSTVLRERVRRMRSLRSLRDRLGS